MKGRGIWLLAGIALCLTACHGAVEPNSLATRSEVTRDAAAGDWTTPSALNQTEKRENPSHSMQTGTTGTLTNGTRSIASTIKGSSSPQSRQQLTRAYSTTFTSTKGVSTTTTSSLAEADPWTYPYDIAVMEAECRTYAESLEWVWKDSLTLTNSSWNGNVSTYPFTKYPDEVTRTLKDSVFEMIALERNYYHGLKTNMRIYFQPHEDSYGDYLIYSLTD